jgi:hypothetical protein
MSNSFVNKHPYLTTLLAIVAIGGVVDVVWGVSPVASRLAGALGMKPKAMKPMAGVALPPKQVA